MDFQLNLNDVPILRYLNQSDTERLGNYFKKAAATGAEQDALVAAAGLYNLTNNFNPANHDGMDIVPPEDLDDAYYQAYRIFSDLAGHGVSEAIDILGTYDERGLILKNRKNTFAP